MATTPKTVRTYPINSVARDFTIPFEYLARKFVVVTLIGATRRELVLNTDYRFSTGTIITTTKAWGPGDGFNLIEIRRLTSATERLVDFADGSILRAYDLNISSVQSLHIAEEARDLTADTIGVNNDGNLDARARRIVNLADAIEDGDAVNLRQQKTWAGSALNQAQAAAQSAAQAAQSAAQALANKQATDQNLAATVQNNSQSLTNNQQSYQNLVAAQQQAAASAASAGASANSATASEASRQASAVSASQSYTDANRSKTEADRAKTEADKLGNFNALGGALSSVNGTQVFWKGEQVSMNAGFQARTGADNEANFTMTDGNGNDPIRLVRTSDRRVHLYGNASGDGDRMVWGSTDVSTPKNFSVGGTLVANGQATFNGNVTTTGLTSTGEIVANGTVRSKSGVVQSFAPNQSANCHFWFYDSVGNSRGVLYADQSGVVRVQAGGALTATFGTDGVTQLNALNANRSGGQSYFYSPYAQIDGAMYGTCNLQLQGTGGGVAALGFHNAGRVAGALWLNNDNQLWWMQNSGNNAQMTTNQNVMNHIGGMTADQVGSIASMYNQSGTNLGIGGGVAGGSLRYASHNNVSGQGGSGSWRCLGSGNNGGVCNYVRYA
ncbi:tail fiber protein [Pseudomonas phage vB_PpuP-Kurepalu-2]